MEKGNPLPAVPAALGGHLGRERTEGVMIDPATCPIIPGCETTIEISKGRTGLGLSIVGGSDTLLVRTHPAIQIYRWPLHRDHYQQISISFIK